MECVPLERVDPGNAGQLGPVERPRRRQHPARPDRIAMVGGGDPMRRRLVPGQIDDLGLEQRAGIEVVMLADPAGMRSEEHTSELQSLMRTSYAVFCLKKKKSICC